MPALAVVPRPVSVRAPDGDLHAAGDPGAVLEDGLTIRHPKGLAGEARWFSRHLEEGTGWQLRLVEVTRGGDGAVGGPSGGGGLDLRLVPEGSLPGLEGLVPGPARHECYRLEIAGGSVSISGEGPAGVFYGLQTLRQLLPDATLRRSRPASSEPIALAPLVVLDGPRFSWRGVHLDVSRHFMPKSFLLELVDLASFHKCNVFHLHLTDDQGWRFPVARYPRLVEVGAWRRESPAGHEDEGRFDGLPHGGYYSPEDLRELVAYARGRHMTVLPEIDMPGHMTAAVAAYPALGNAGEPRDVWTRWGISDHVLNLDDATLEFCTDVLDEVVDLFPGPYVHVGGDECPTIEWRSSESARARMEEQGLSCERELQGWFTARIAEHLASRDRIVVCWDELLDAGVPPGAVVMSWRSEHGGVAAAIAGHDVVMTPQQWCYLDWAHDDGPSEPLAIRGSTSVEKVYGFEPVPDAMPPEARHRVLGAQCQLWTEYVSTPLQAEYLYFPRLCAFAEVVWTPLPSSEARSFEEFEVRLDRHCERLSALGVNVRPLSGPTPGQARSWAGSPGSPGSPVSSVSS